MVIVGGGNTFQLLKVPQSRFVGADCRCRQTRGAVYRLECRFKPRLPDHSHHQRYADCRSAGFDALGLFPLQINPHFTNALPDRASGRNPRTAYPRTAGRGAGDNGDWFAGGNWIRVTDGHATLGGPNPTLLFKAGKKR